MKKYFLSLLFLGAAFSNQAQEGPVKNFQQPQNLELTVVTTAENTQNRLTVTEHPKFEKRGQPVETEPCIFVDPSKNFQLFVGVGGALTDASAETFFKLSSAKQEEFLKAYFNKESGIGYSLARTNMNSCDFSSSSYTYVEEKDKKLKSFSIAPDLKFKVPFIKKSFEAAGNDLKLYFSPWSPPAWMKSNNDMLHGGKLLPEYYQSWADYYVKFINEYEKAGVPIWGFSVQNEPMATQTWESCIYTAEEERDFILNYLGPTIMNNKLENKKLIAWDHNRDLLYQRASVLLSDPKTAKYIWGIGFHWYESWTGAPIYENVKRVSEAFPNKHIFLTEACNYPFSWKTIDEWKWGENYGEAMINDFNNGACAWTDWNVLLDETGGPNHVQNFCFAPIVADTKSDKLHYMNSFFYIGHFSKYIRPGARRIACSSSRAQLLTTGFRNSDGTIAVVVMNPAATPVKYFLYLSGYATELTALPHSIVTVFMK